MERRLLKIFKKKFKRRLDYGREYFEGKRANMLAVIYAEMTKEIEIELKDDPDDPIEIDEQDDLDEQDEVVDVDEQDKQDEQEKKEKKKKKDKKEKKEKPKGEETADKKEGSRLFQCDICHYNTLVESCYKKHLESAKHVLFTAETNTKSYRCDKCDYVTIKKSCYDRHLTTTKHKLETRIIKNDEGKLVCNYCSKVYNSRQGLWEHRRKCSKSKKRDKDTGHEEKEGEKEVSTAPPPLENTLVSSSSEAKTQESTSEVICRPCNESDNNTFINNAFFMRILDQNQKFLDKLKRENTNALAAEKFDEITQQHMAITNNMTNININPQFNLNVFLNQICMDAMNLDEFLNTIRPTFDELLMMGNTGFVDGISEIIIKRLRALDITKRPIHCTNPKVETIFLKENDEWVNDDRGHFRLKNFIEKIENLVAVTLNNWCDVNPDAMVENHEKNLLREKIYKQTRRGTPDTREKVARNIAKGVTVDRNAVMLRFGRR